MANSPADLDLEALDAYLMSDTSPEGCFLLCDLDGFLTGIVVGPEPMPTNEWISAIWGAEEPEFESEQQRQTIFDTIMGRYSEIAPITETDPGTSTQFWSSGRTAMWLSPIGLPGSPTPSNYAAKHGNQRLCGVDHSQDWQDAT